MLAVAHAVKAAMVAGLAIAGSARCDRNDPYIVPHAVLARELRLARYRATPWSATTSPDAVRLLLALYPRGVVDTVYQDSASGAVSALRVQLHSGLLGVATLNYDSAGLTRIDLFNSFDQRLLKALAPSYSIYVFADESGTYVFDGIAEKLYAGYPNGLRSLTPGLQASPR
jgi:hypothetical protein